LEPPVRRGQIRRRGNDGSRWRSHPCR
jgi:hypothetical protein